MHIFFSAGEPSGDLHTSKLILELQRRHPGIRCSAYGGPLMAEAGCELIFRLTDMAVMGFLRVVPLLLKFYRLVCAADQYFQEHRPDAVVLVDFPGFNWWIARRARRRGIPVFYYLPPQLWGWAPWRVKRMRRFVDHVLCCLPFEAAWYRERGVEAQFVGHPFFDEVAERRLDEDALREMADRGRNRRTVGVLPGSRRHELLHNFSLQIDIMRRLSHDLPETRFLVACYKQSHLQYCREQLNRHAPELPVELHVGRTSEIIELAEVCLMVSGSVSLELLARKTPAVVIYHLGRLLHALKGTFITCPFISLPNLIADRLIMPEFTPSGKAIAEAGQITGILHTWLTEPAAHASVVAELESISARVATSGATANAAAAILGRLQTPARLPRDQRSAA